MGALCGVIGSLQALETIKLLLGIGESLKGRLLMYDGLAQTFRTLELKRAPSCRLCGDDRRVSPPAGAQPSIAPALNREHAGELPIELSVAEAKQLLDSGSKRVTLIDVREPWETEICRIQNSEHIPMRQIPEQLASLPTDRHLLILCHHGSRSRNVTEYLRNQGFTAVSNITGGIAAWAESIEPAMQRY